MLAGACLSHVPSPPCSVAGMASASLCFISGCKVTTQNPFCVAASREFVGVGHWYQPWARAHSWNRPNKVTGRVVTILLKFNFLPQSA